jgi:hypothetical protein
LPATRGKAFKMVSQLLYDLPATETYRIVFMESRDLMRCSPRRRRCCAAWDGPRPREEMKRAYVQHLERLHEWLPNQQNPAILCVSYNALLDRPEQEATRVSEFLGGRPDVGGMVRTVDPALYRNRKTPGETIPCTPG